MFFSHVFDEPIYDPLRLLLISGIAFLAGALTYFYILKMSLPRRKHGMFWGAISAVTFMVIAAVDQLDKLGESISWRFPLLWISVISGIIAIYLSLRYKGTHSDH